MHVQSITPTNGKCYADAVSSNRKYVEINNQTTNAEDGRITDLHEV